MSDQHEQPGGANGSHPGGGYPPPAPDPGVYAWPAPQEGPRQAPPMAAPPWGYPPPWHQGWSPLPGYVQPGRAVPTHRSPLPSFPHPEPRPYHQMLRTWTYAWWKPVIGILIAITGALVAPLLLFPVLIFGLWVEGNLSAATLQKVGSLQTVDPAGLLWLNLGLASMILVAWFVMRVVHRMRPRWLASVMPKMRWRFFFACLGLAAVALLAQVMVSTLLPGAQEGDVTGKLNSFTSTTAVLALVVLFTTPLQAAGEEYLFRGYLLQALGSLFRSKWVAILGTAAMFTLAHGLHQNPPLYFDRFMFGLIAGWLVTRTGGLEAGIAMHILNNFLAFGFALSFGNLTDTLNVSEVGWWNIPLTLTQSGVYALLVVLLARKMGLRTKTSPPVEPPAAQASYDVAPVPSGA